MVSFFFFFTTSLTVGGTTDAKHQSKELMKFPLEGERTMKNPAKKNWIGQLQVQVSQG